MINKIPILQQQNWGAGGGGGRGGKELATQNY